MLMLPAGPTVLVNRDSLPATLGFDFRILPKINPNVTYSLTSLFPTNHLGYYATRYVTPEDGMKARQVTVLRLEVAEGIDEDRIVSPDLPRSRADKIKEQGEKMKKRRIEEYHAKQAAAKPEEVVKDEL